MTLPLDRATLRQIAEAATAGPWTSDGSVSTWWSGQRPGICVRYETPGDPTSQDAVCFVDDMRAGRCSGSLRPVEDAAFIATFNPSTVLALLAEIERLEQPCSCCVPECPQDGCRCKTDEQRERDSAEEIPHA